MVILDHVDVNKLNVNHFRKVTCPCELCDCGCFDRMKYKHVSACKRKNQPVKEKVMAHTSLGCPLSHYKDTFKANPNFRPPTAYMPPPDRYVPQVPMDFSTVQKLEFKPLPMTDRTKGYKIIETYIPPKEPLEVTSSYQNDYPSKDHFPKTEIVKRHPNTQTTVRILDKLSDKTTSKEHYPEWHSEGPVKAFTEFPSYAGEALFPTKERHFTTTTSTSHPPMGNIQRTKSFIRLENKGSIGLQGSMDLNTNYRNTYVQYPNTERVKPFDPNAKENSNMAISTNTAPMQSVTQTKSDFVHYKNFHPPKPADVDPYVSNLNLQIYPQKIHDLTTSYSKEFKGHDTRLNPKPLSYKKEPLEYKQPTEKIDGETITMRDYKPIDINLVPRLKIIKGTPTLKRVDEPMESQTTSKRHFIKYDVKPITLATDPMPYYYIQSKDKFDCRTTNEDNYYAKKTDRVTAFRPDMNILDRKGSFDFQSNYRNTYIDHGLTMCEAKAYMLAQAISEKDQQQEPTGRSIQTANKKKAPRVPSSTKFSTKLVPQAS